MIQAIPIFPSLTWRPDASIFLIYDLVAAGKATLACSGRVDANAKHLFQLFYYFYSNKVLAAQEFDLNSSRPLPRLETQFMARFRGHQSPYPGVQMLLGGYGVVKQGLFRCLLRWGFWVAAFYALVEMAHKCISKEGF